MKHIQDSLHNEQLQNNYWENRCGKGEIESYPSALMIESTTRCNLRCAFCQEHGYPTPDVLTHSRPTTFPMELLSKLENAYRYSKFVELYGFGEPFASNAMWEIIDYMMDRVQDVAPRKVFIVSNGHFEANKLNLDRAMGDTVNRIVFSCSAATQETRNFLQGGSLQRVHENAHTLIAERKARGLEKDIIIAASFLATRSNLYEMCDMLETFFQFGVNHINLNTLIRFKPSHMDSWVLKRSNRTFRYRDELLDTESEEWISEFGRAKEIAEKYGKILSYNQTLESKLKRQSIKDCKYPYRACTIATNGNVYPCCENNNSPMGNLHDNNFEDIWFGVKYKDLRKSMENKIIPTICRGRLCSYIAGGI